MTDVGDQVLVDGSANDGLRERARPLVSEQGCSQFQLTFQHRHVHESESQPSQHSQLQLAELEEQIGNSTCQLQEEDGEVEVKQGSSYSAGDGQPQQNVQEVRCKRLTEMTGSLSEASRRDVWTEPDDKGGVTELHPQLQEKVRKLHEQLRKAPYACRTAQAERTAADDSLKTMQGRSEKDQRVNALGQQLKTTPPVPKPRPQVVKQLRERNEVLEKENSDLKCEVEKLKQCVDILSRRVSQELDERDRLTGLNKSMEQMLREQVNQTAENKELKNQFVALSDAHRLQQKELDDALHQRDVVQAEKIEQLTRHLTAAQQQVNTERQRSSAEISALQQRIQRLETDGHHQHQSSSQAFGQLQFERDQALREKHQTRQQYDEMLHRYQMVEQEREQLGHELRFTRDALDQTTGRLMAAEETLEEKQAGFQMLEAEMRELREELSTIPVLEHQSEVWQSDFEAEREARVRAVEEKESLQLELELLRQQPQEAEDLRLENKIDCDDDDDDDDDDKTLDFEDEPWNTPLHRGEDGQGSMLTGSALPGHCGSRESYGTEKYAIPSTSSRRSGSYGFLRQQSYQMSTLSSDRTVQCPKCELSFRNMHMFQIHADDCIP